MPIKRLVLVCSLSSLLTGCAEFYGSQPPAPVQGEQPDTYVKTAPVKPKSAKKTKQLKQPTQSKLPKQRPEPTVKVQPLEDSGPVITAPIEATPMPSASPLTQEQPAAPALPIQPSEPAAPTESIQPLEPLALTTPLSPAVGALVSSANQSTRAGNLEEAVASVERAIRIEPRNAALFYKLAELRLKQSKPRLAEDLAKKSVLLASRDNNLKKQSWLLIANARVMLKDFEGAKEARAKAAGL